MCRALSEFQVCAHLNIVRKHFSIILLAEETSKNKSILFLLTVCFIQYKAKKKNNNKQAKKLIHEPAQVRGLSSTHRK